MATAIAPSNVPAIPLSTRSLPEVMDFVDGLWRYHAAIIINGSTNEIRIPFPVKAFIGQQGLDVIKARFQYMIGKAVDTYENNFLGYVGMRTAPDRGPDQLLTHNAPELKMKKKVADKKTKVPRPPNAFILYRQHHHPLVKAEYPDMHNNQISVILGTQWKNETVSNKLHWNNVADEIKKKHFQDNPEYSYQPRKPSEKKRRMTRHKAAVLAGRTDTLFASSSSVKISSSTTPPSDELLVGDPAFQRTQSGNAIVDIGDADISDAMLTAMLLEFNEDQPAIVVPNGQSVADHVPSITYMEDDEASASDKNFYLNVVDYEKLFNESQAEMAMYAALPNPAVDANAAWNLLTVPHQTTLFDSENAPASSSEMNWMDQTLPENDILSQDNLIPDSDPTGYDAMGHLTAAHATVGDANMEYAEDDWFFKDLVDFDA